MKLNHECIRDLLLYLEDNLLFTSHLCANDLEIFPYSHDTIPIIHIHSLTWDGHKLLDNIRDENVWSNTKSMVTQFSSVSIGIIDNVSNKIITKMINEHI